MGEQMTNALTCSSTLMQVFTAELQRDAALVKSVTLPLLRLS